MTSPPARLGLDRAFAPCPRPGAGDARNPPRRQHRELAGCEVQATTSSATGTPTSVVRVAPSKADEPAVVCGARGGADPSTGHHGPRPPSPAGGLTAPLALATRPVPGTLRNPPNVASHPRARSLRGFKPRRPPHRGLRRPGQSRASKPTSPRWSAGGVVTPRAGVSPLPRRRQDVLWARTSWSGRRTRRAGRRRVAGTPRTRRPDTNAVLPRKRQTRRLTRPAHKTSCAKGPQTRA